MAVGGYSITALFNINFMDAQAHDNMGKDVAFIQLSWMGCHPPFQWRQQTYLGYDSMLAHRYR